MNVNVIRSETVRLRAPIIKPNYKSSKLMGRCHLIFPNAIYFQWTFKGIINNSLTFEIELVRVNVFFKFSSISHNKGIEGIRTELQRKNSKQKNLELGNILRGGGSEKFKFL